MLKFGRSYEEERIIYLALERISLLSKILENLNFLIWHHVAVHLGHPSVSWLSVFSEVPKYPSCLVACWSPARLGQNSCTPPSLPHISSNFFGKKKDHGCWRWGWGRGAVAAPRNPWCPLAADSVPAWPEVADWGAAPTGCGGGTASPASGQPTLHIVNRPRGGIACRLPKWHRATQVSRCHGRRLSWCLHSSSCCYVVIYFARHSSSSPGALKRLPIHTPHDVRCMRRSKQVAASVCWCGRHDRDWFSDSEELDKCRELV